MAAQVVELLLERNGAVLASKARIAASFSERLIGLMGRSGLEQGEGLILRSCRSIHTWFMKFPIDVVFVNQAWNVVAILPNLAPWKMSPMVWRANQTIELPTGTIEACQLQVGDKVSVR